MKPMLTLFLALVAVAFGSAAPKSSQKDFRILTPFPVKVEPGNRFQDRYRTVAVKRGDLKAVVRTTGIVQPEEVVDVGAQVAGVIEKLGTDPDDAKKTIDWTSKVDVGTVLAQIDPTLFKAAVDQAKAKMVRALAGVRVAEARLTGAERDWQRAQNLGKAISKAELDGVRSRLEVAGAEVEVARAEVDLARADLKSAEANLGYCTITSPVKGVVIDRRVNVGQTVVSSLTAPSLFLIAKDLKRLQVWASVFEADIGHLKVGQKATFTVDAFPGEVFQADVRQIRLNASMTQNAVTYTVVLPFDNSNLKLLPYLTAEVRITTAEKKKNALLVPAAAWRWWPNDIHNVPLKPTDPYRPRGYVWVEGKDLLRPVYVRRGFMDEQAVELTAGDIAVGDRVVVGDDPPLP
jgi:HlyD family secretion protein